MADIIRVNMKEIKVTRSLEERYALLGGRALSSRVIYNEVDPSCEPLGEGNKLVIAPGLLSGTPASSSSRISIGAKSPLTLGIKEANCGGNSGYYLSRMGIQAIIIEGLPKDEQAYVLKIGKDGACLEIFHELKGLGTYDTCEKLFERYGRKISILCIGPAGEHRMRAACVASSDPQGELKFAARGGMGAVMGSKGIKAVVVDNPRNMQVSYKNKEGFLITAKKYNNELIGDPKTKTIYQRVGTNGIFKAVNSMGAMTVRNFSAGSYDFVDNLCGETMYETIQSRGGEGKAGVSCMNGCVIKCSNIYPDSSGKKICSTLQYENVALLGANCGMEDLDSVARLNHLCNDIGLDTIETGATLGVAMEMGFAEFGDGKGCQGLLEEIRANTLLGRVLGNGAKVTGEILGCRRIPAAKGQAFPGYDPRALKGNGVTYATSPMGADHTAGNCFGARGEVDPLGTDKQGDLSRNTQIKMTTLDSLGLCIFSRIPLFKNPALLVDMINDLWGADLDIEMVWKIGEETIKIERDYNMRAGISPVFDRLPEYMYKEKLLPNGHVFDLPTGEVQKAVVEAEHG